MTSVVKLFVGSNAQDVEAQINAFVAAAQGRVVSANITVTSHETGNRLYHHYAAIIVLEAPSS